MRLSLAGAGTDVPGYADKYGGAVLMATIDRYAYAMVSETPSPTVQISSSDYEADDQQIPAREILRQFGINQGVSVFLTTELPRYSGMSAISAGAIALVRAVAELKERPMDVDEIATMAYQSAVSRLGIPLGIGEFYGVAHGGITYVEVNGGGVQVEPLAVSRELKEALEARFMLFSTGRQQKSSESLLEFRRAAERNKAGVIQSLHEIKAAARTMREGFLWGEYEALGANLDRTWRASRELARGMTDPWVDQWYDAAINAGASGGKMNGLAGFGFLVLFCEPDRQPKVTEVLSSMGLQRVDIHLERAGVTMLLNEGLVPADMRPPPGNPQQ